MSYDERGLAGFFGVMSYAVSSLFIFISSTEIFVLLPASSTAKYTRCPIKVCPFSTSRYAAAVLPFSVSFCSIYAHLSSVVSISPLDRLPEPSYSGISAMFFLVNI